MHADGAATLDSGGGKCPPVLRCELKFLAAIDLSKCFFTCNWQRTVDSKQIVEPTTVGGLFFSVRTTAAPPHAKSARVLCMRFGLLCKKSSAT